MEKIGNKIVHNVYTLMVSDLILANQTNNNRYLLRYKIVPLIFVKGAVSELLKKINDLFNDNNIDDILDEEKYRQISYVKILQLKNLYNGLYNLIVSKTKNNLTKKEIGITVKEKKTNLSTFISKVKELTGIEVKSIEDLNKFSAYISHKEDKYIEVFKTMQSQDDNTVSFVRMAVGLFSIMDMNYTEDISVFALSEIQKSALDRVRKMQQDGTASS